MRSTKETEFDLLENDLDFIDNSLKPILKSKNNHDLKSLLSGKPENLNYSLYYILIISISVFQF
jgi:hypothetical protein